jgi:hypothetical protein
MTKRKPAVRSQERPKHERDADEAAVERLTKRRETKAASPRTRSRFREDGTLEIGSIFEDADLDPEHSQRIVTARIADLFATSDGAFVDFLQAGLINATSPDRTDEALSAAVKGGLAFMAAIEPRNELEAVLAAQMYAVHSATMHASKHLHGASMRDAYQDYSTAVNKLARTFTTQVETLAKLRSGGKQQVEVRYVYVDARTQTVVAQGADEGGGKREIGRQCHARLAADIAGAMPPVWGEDPQGHAVPVSSGSGQSPVPDARGDESRRSNRGEERELSARNADEGGD